MSASLSNEQIEDRFFLMGRMEILNVLNDLIHHREPVTVFFNGGNDSMLTMLLDARSDELVFDLSGDARNNNALAKASTCVFVAAPGGIRVQFSGEQIHRVSWGETEAFRIPLPDRVIRLQRRECYRNVLPLIKGLKAQLFDEHGAILADWVLHNLSVGGFGVNVTGACRLKTGDQIARVNIMLPSRKPLECAAQIRHITQLDKTGQGKSRVGVAFVDLAHGMEVSIQRYIIQIEYERRKLLMK